MSIIENSGLKQPAIATERGWETYDGKLIISSRNLLTNRVMRNIATPTELKNWADAQFLDIEYRENKILSAVEINKSRLKAITDKFEAETSEMSKSESTLVQIEFLKRKIEYLKMVFEYEKSFQLSDKELLELNNKKEKVSFRLSSLLVKTTPEVISETVFASKTNEEKKQENKPDKSSEPKKVEVQKKKRKGRFGPKPGWKLRKAQAEAEAARLAAEKENIDKLEPYELNNLDAAATIADYPVPEAEITND